MLRMRSSNSCPLFHLPPFPLPAAAEGSRHPPETGKMRPACPGLWKRGKGWWVSSKGQRHPPVHSQQQNLSPGLFSFLQTQAAKHSTGHHACKQTCSHGRKTSWRSALNLSLPVWWRKGLACAPQTLFCCQFSLKPKGSRVLESSKPHTQLPTGLNKKQWFKLGVEALIRGMRAVQGQREGRPLKKNWGSTSQSSNLSVGKHVLCLLCEGAGTEMFFLPGSQRTWE